MSIVAERRETVIERIRTQVLPEEGKIPFFIFSDPEVYELEQERIFSGCWLFVAHESEIPNPGDYVTRSMGRTKVIVVRGEDGRIRVFLNACRHRGMRLCRAELGNTSHFRCPYHGFTYKNTGELIGIPYQKQVYGERIDKSELSLIQARCESYRGLVFATWNKEAENLEEYLGDAKWYLDLVCARDEMEVVGHPQIWRVKTSWKIPSENFQSDAYHTLFSHASIAKVGLAPTMDFAYSGYQIDLGKGHGLGLGMPSDKPIFYESLFDEYAKHLNPEQVEVLRKMKNMHGTIFPNFSFLISAAFYKGRLLSHTTIRLWQPVAHDAIDVISFQLMEKHGSEEWKTLTHELYVLTFGPGGIFEQDDAENWTNIFETAQTVGAQDFALNYTMAMGKKPVDFVGPGKAYPGKYSEENARSFYRRWKELIVGEV